MLYLSAMSDYDPNYAPSYAPFVLSVKVLIFNDSDELLVLQRSDKTSHPHGWDYAGGGVDKGESPDDAARREILEETGLSINEVSIFSTYHGHSRGHEYVMLGYTAYTSTSEVALSWEHEAYRWVSLEEAAALDLPVQYRAFLDAYQRHTV